MRNLTKQLFSLCFFTCMGLTAAENAVEASESEIAIDEKYLPQVKQREYFSQEPEQQQGKLISKNLKGCVLVARKSDGVIGDATSGVQVRIKDARCPKCDLEKALEPFIGKPLRDKDLEKMQAVIEKVYGDNGVPVMIVQVPTQVVKNDCITLVVRCATLDKLTVTGNKYFKKSRYENYLDIKEGDIIDQNQLFKDVNFINRNPFRRADVVYSPGDKDCSTNVNLIVQDVRPFRVYVGADNTGVLSTGRERYFVGANWGNVFGLDHTLSYQYTTNDFNRFEAHTGYYSAPLPWKHVLSIFGGYSRVKTGLPLQDTASEGDSIQVSGRYTVPLCGCNMKKLQEFSIGVDFKRSNSNILETVENEAIFTSSVNLLQMAAGYSLKLYDDKTTTSFEADAFWSPGTFITDMSHNDFQSLRPGSYPKYIYATASFVQSHVLKHDFVLSMLLKGQIANRNLLPSETFGLGGATTVRGYEERQSSTDNGVLFSAELYTPPTHIFRLHKTRKLNDALKFLFFVDAGVGTNHHKEAGEPTDLYFIGVGPGFRYNIGNNFSAKFDWGWKLHHKKGVILGGNSKVHLSLVGSY